MELPPCKRGRLWGEDFSESVKNSEERIMRRAIKRALPVYFQAGRALGVSG
jgi:hypothetical protein